jgi:hypothetical protein
MSESRKKQGWAFWAVVLFVVLPFLYVASFGPASWLVSRDAVNAWDVISAYEPILAAMDRGPDWLRSALNAYAAIWDGSGAVYYFYAMSL